MMSTYRYFSHVFSYPTEENLGQMIKLSAGIPGLRAHETLAALPLENVQAEYTRVFISTYPALLCPPYESYYREGLVYGNSSIEAMEWYRKHGLDFTWDSEPPDHLSVELEFLAITEDPAFQEKLREWAAKFTERVKANSKIYGACAEELENFLHMTNGNISQESNSLLGRNFLAEAQSSQRKLKNSPAPEINS